MGPGSFFGYSALRWPLVALETGTGCLSPLSNTPLGRTDRVAAQVPHPPTLIADDSAVGRPDIHSAVGSVWKEKLSQHWSFQQYLHRY